MEQRNGVCLFGKRNYIIFLIGTVLIVIGYVLMSGDGSDVAAYQPDIFSEQRICIAPLLCLAGYLVNIVGIMITPFAKQKQIDAEQN